MKTILEHARYYRSKGFSIIPLSPKSKIPSLDTWKEYQGRHATDEEVERWFGNGSKKNIGIITGQISGLTVVDLDGQAAYDYAEQNSFPDAPTVISGKGKHLYCRYKDGSRNFQKRADLPGIDLRSEGGYVVAPPSIHESGRQYQWEEGKCLDDIELPEMPEIILAKSPSDKTPIDRLYKGVRKGSRHDSLVKLLGTMLNTKASYDTCLSFALTWNQQNNPPDSDDVIVATVTDLYERYTSPNKKQKEDSSAEILLKMAAELTLFLDQHKEPHVIINNKAVLLRNKAVKQFLAHEFRVATGKTIAPNIIAQVTTALEGKAMADGNEFVLENRIARRDDAFWYDLANGYAIRTTGSGWDIVEVPCFFRSFAHQQPQLLPIRGGNPWLVLDYLNIPDRKQQILFLCFLVSCLVPEIPHPVFYTYGDHGAGKSILSKITKQLIDPSVLKATIAHRDYAQFIQVLSHHYVCIFDNMSELPVWMSDILAQACTGAAFSKRQHFTDDDDIIYQIQRCVGLNGINMLIAKADLMDRALLFRLGRIVDDKRIEEGKLWDSFESRKPEILGGLFDTLSIAMQIYQDVKLKKLPRMADFAKWGAAIALALGLTENDFLDAYYENIRIQQDEVIKSNSLLQSIIAFMDDKDKWHGMVKGAYESISLFSSGNKDDASFPRHANQLIRGLQEIKVNLEDSGIVFTIEKSTSKGTPIRFEKI